ncbi:MAG: PQQ-binding-like beta-propeller repeat protein [Gammaproteobacteria bacterium]|nr:PQQ-binding-like beta-propeller repeat protein [Gammaproteobacteria bacterium]
MQDKKIRTVLGAILFLLWAAAPPTSLHAAEFSQIRPGSDEFMELPAEDWLKNGGDFYNRNYSQLSQINTENVGEMIPIWRTHLDGSGLEARFSGEAQPVVHEGTMYIVTGADDVFALSVETGEILWRNLANLSDEISTVCCGWTNRGVAIGEDKVFIGQLDGLLKAIDKESGRTIWETQAEDWKEGYTITSAPLYFEGLVISGFAGAEFAARGRVKAYDASDGSLVWTFFTVPGPGEFGHDTWPSDNNSWQTGGGTVWHTPAVDPDLGLLYFSTGNPGPDYNGAIRPGDNLFTASIVAIDAYTGQYRWHFQQVHHDIWDYDAPNPVVLFDLDYGGVERKGLAQAGKTGWVYILDRVTGEPLVGIEERPVPQEPRQATAATQPFPIGDPFVTQTLDIPPEGFNLTNEGRIFTPFWDEPILLKRGEANWPPSTVDPDSGIMYVCAGERQAAYSTQIDTDEASSGDRYTGGAMRFAPVPTTGVIAAVNLRDNKVVWSQRWSSRCYSGLVASAGGLVFAGRNDGRFTAMDSSDGKKLWEFMTDAGVNAPPATFEHEGEQYVAVLSAGNLLAGSKRGDSVWLFGLNSDGVQRSLTLEEVTPPLSTFEGQSLYGQNCVFCHGRRGEGGHNGMPLEGLAEFPTNYVSRIITSGLNNMPSFNGLLTSSEISAIAEHVRTLNQEIANRNRQ